MSRYIILGLLANKPMSGYDIKNWILNGVGHFWCISYGQIYPALRSFVDDGLANFTAGIKNERPEKKVYTITDKGRSIIEKWLREPIDFQSDRYAKLLTVKVYFGAIVGKEVTAKHVAEALDHENKKLQNLLKVHKEMTVYRKQAIEIGDSSYTYRMCTLNEGIIMVKAQIEWYKNTIELLKNEESVI